MDAIFKALNDPTRRALLDSLRDRDGQTLTDLSEGLEMTRFGVMKHLSLLEEAGLITTVKKGRFKYHYLNAVPLQQVIDRWIEPLIAKPRARALLSLKAELEGGQDMPKDQTRPDLVMHTYIHCSHDALWEALTDGAAMARYHFASDLIEGSHRAPGEAIVLKRPDGSAMLTEKVIAIDPKSLIETTFEPGWEGAAPSRCRFLLEPAVEGMKLTVEHYELGGGDAHVNDGWTRFLSGLKTYLETGQGRKFGPAESEAAGAGA